MYYKIIYQNMVIDVIKNPRYVRWLKRGQRFARTESTSANGIMASDRINVYHVDTMPTFNGVENYKTVQMVEIEKDEYDKFMSLMVKKRHVSVFHDELDDPEVLKNRIVELQNEVNMLTECILEMSTTIYS